MTLFLFSRPRRRRRRPRRHRPIRLAHRCLRHRPLPRSKPTVRFVEVSRSCPFRLDTRTTISASPKNTSSTFTADDNVRCLQRRWNTRLTRQRQRTTIELTDSPSGPSLTVKLIRCNPSTSIIQRKVRVQRSNSTKSPFRKRFVCFSLL